MVFDYTEKGYCTFRIGNSLRKQTNSISSGYGVYIIHANSENGQILYIVASGKVKQDGTYTNQNLRERINNKQRSIGREKFFIDRMKEDKTIQQLVIEWYVIDETKYLPTYCEATLIQDYYSQHSCLPKWNAEY